MAVFLLLLLPMMSWANPVPVETIRFGASLALAPCVKSSPESACSVGIPLPLPQVEIQLAASEGSFPSGEIKKTLSYQGYDYEISLSVTHFNIRNDDHYYFSAVASWMKTGQLETLQVRPFGSISVANPQGLNDTFWSTAMVRDAGFEMQAMLELASASLVARH